MTPARIRLLAALIDDHGHALIANAFGVPSETIVGVLNGKASRESAHPVAHCLGRIEIVHKELFGWLPR